MIDQVDTAKEGVKSGEIEFEEFLQFIKNSNSDPGTAQVQKFFKNFANDKFGKDLPFSLFVSKTVRKRLINAVTTQNKTDMQILNNLKNYKHLI